VSIAPVTQAPRLGGLAFHFTGVPATRQRFWVVFVNDCGPARTPSLWEHRTKRVATGLKVLWRILRKVSTDERSGVLLLTSPKGWSVWNQRIYLSFDMLRLWKSKCNAISGSTHCSRSASRSCEQVGPAIKESEDRAS